MNPSVSEDWLPYQGVPFLSDWADHAACKGMDANIFFLEKGKATARAKATCARCGVVEPCLEYSLRWFINHGVWGGMSVRERRNLRRRRQRRAAREVA